MFYAYLLQSEPTGRFYIGSAVDPEARLVVHNRGHTPSTRSNRPWRLVWMESFVTRAEAVHRERYLKSQKSRIVLQALVDAAIREMAVE